MADIRITTSTIYTVNGVNFTTVAEALKHVEELLTEPVKVIASTTDKDTNTLSKHYPVTLTLLEMFRHGKYDYNIGIYHHAFQNTAEYSVFEMTFNPTTKLYIVTIQKMNQKIWFANVDIQFLLQL
jgi:hypothetical protein